MAFFGYIFSRKINLKELSATLSLKIISSFVVLDIYRVLEQKEGIYLAAFIFLLAPFC